MAKITIEFEGRKICPMFSNQFGCAGVCCMEERCAWFDDEIGLCAVVGVPNEPRRTEMLMRRKSVKNVH